MLTNARVSAYADDMETTLQIAEGAASNDPDVGLRAVAALRALAERLELLQVQQARELGWSWQDIAGRLGVTSALLGARTMDHLDGLLAGLDVALTDDVLDRIDEIVPPGTDVGALDQAYQPPALEDPGLRRRPQTERGAA